MLGVSVQAWRDVTLLPGVLFVERGCRRRIVDWIIAKVAIVVLPWRKQSFCVHESRMKLCDLSLRHNL